jgi:hypothetical protein
MKSMLRMSVGMFVLALGLLATAVLVPSVGNAQGARVAKLMAALKDGRQNLGLLGSRQMVRRDGALRYLARMSISFDGVGSLAFG